MPEFHDTRKGRIFYEHTLPALVGALERLAVAMERLAERHGDEPGTENPEPKDDEP